MCSSPLNVYMLPICKSEAHCNLVMTALGALRNSMILDDWSTGYTIIFKHEEVVKEGMEGEPKISAGLIE